MKEIMNPGFGFGGMLAVDVGNQENADKLMTKMQKEEVGYLAVSLGYFKTLFTSPGSSTASEIPKEEQEKLGLSDGLIRMSVGIDNDIKRSFKRITRCVKQLDLAPTLRKQDA
jgi:methionine-gamma-lyase